jgi:divalent metal cation (Fe/Co/Zn/Cd) transporter
MLIDESLPAAEQAEIRQCIEEHTRLLVSYHELRTRKLGSQHQIDLHLVMPRDATVAETHQLCDHLEDDLKSRIPHAEITIHVEPCQDECESCSAACNLPGRGHAATA